MEVDLSFLKTTNLKWLEKNTVFLCLSGSHAYGMATATSDIDLRGVCIPPKKYYLSCFQKFEQAEFKHPNDAVIFGISKWFSLASKCNPNVIEFIFTDPNDFISIHPVFEEVIARKHEFLSKKARYTYMGYAISQWNRLKLHRSFLLTPPKGKPKRSDFGLPELNQEEDANLKIINSIIKKQLDKWNPNFNGLERSERLELEENINSVLNEICNASIYLSKRELWREAAVQAGIDDNLIVQLNREKRYQHSCEDYNKYLEWVANRNPIRAALEAKYGFDCKFASNVVRLERQGEEILNTGTFKVKRDDAAELLSIRNGAWTYEQLEEFCSRQEVKFKDAYEKSKLQHKTNESMLDGFCQNIICEFLDI